MEPTIDSLALSTGCWRSPLAPQQATTRGTLERFNEQTSYGPRSPCLATKCQSISSSAAPFSTERMYPRSLRFRHLSLILAVASVSLPHRNQRQNRILLHPNVSSMS